MQGNIERFSGFAADYHATRPRPPAVLKDILMHLARYWADAAEEVVGIEPNDGMRSQAARVTLEPNVRCSNGLSTRTGLPDQSADVMTCSQSIHMDGAGADLQGSRPGPEARRRVGLREKGSLR
jgi:hypothetical protein